MGRLIICGVDCTGYRPSAMDPLAQYKCPFTEVHTEDDKPRQSSIPVCYIEQPIDQHVADEVEELKTPLERMPKWKQQYLAGWADGFGKYYR